MRYRRLGNSGLEVSVVGIGTNRFGGNVAPAEVRSILDKALELGVNFLDTADIYQGGRSEEAIGEALAGRRDRFVIATKVGMKFGDGPNSVGASRHRILEGIEASLRRLKTEYIDLYQIHRFDPDTPFEETMRALDDLVRSGKVRYIGASNYAAWQLCYANGVAERHGWSKFVTIQPHYHMLERQVEAELLGYCKAFSVGIIPYYPLAGGFLTGKYKKGQPAPPGSRGESSSYVQKYFTDRNFSIVERLSHFAEARGRSLGELAIAWLLSRPQVSSVIAGVTSLAQLEWNAKAADWELSAEEIEAVDAVLNSED